MIIRQEGEKAFIPITITLQTEEEANYLWHKLNCCCDWYKYQMEHKVSDYINFWDSFNDLYTPSSEK
jgi:hypothetical protein